MTSLHLYAAMLLAVCLLMTSSVAGSSAPVREPRQRIRHPSLPPSTYNFRRTLQRMNTAHDWGTHHARILNYEDNLNQLGLSSWGLDWSTKMMHHPAAVQPRHHVTSTSNSYSNLPSPASVYSNIYKPPAAIMSPSPAVYYSSPMFSSSRRPFPNPHDRVHQADRFKLGPSSSSSNTDQLSDFSNTLNNVKITQDSQSYPTLENEVQEKDFQPTEQIPQDEEETVLAQSDVGFEAVEPSHVVRSEDEQSEYDNRVREMFSSLSNARFEDENLVEDEEYHPTVAEHQGNFVMSSGEIFPSVIEEIGDDEGSSDVTVSDNFVINDNSDNFQHIFLNDIFDVSQLVQDNLIDSNKVETERKNDTMIFDEGKSFSSQSNSPRKLIQIIADGESSGDEDSEHKTILLTILNPQSRKKGTKLKGSSIAEINSMKKTNNSPNLVSMSFAGLRTPPVPVVAAGNNFDSNVDFQTNVEAVQEFDVIGKQIAAMNRIGDADVSEDVENVSAESLTQENGAFESAKQSDITPDSDTNTQSQSNSTLQNSDDGIEKGTESQIGQDQNEKDDSTLKVNATKSSQELVYKTEGRWSSTAKNKYKQLIPGYLQSTGSNQFKSAQYPESTGKVQSSGSYPVAVQAGQNYGSIVTGNQEPTAPYEQKYPGWADVVPYRYHEEDPITGAYKFGYGDAYQWRQEERRSDGVTFGGFGWLDETGKHHVTRFISDARGYRVLEPGQQIDFNVIPVFPPTPSPEDQSSGGSSFSYGDSNPTLDKESFVTPRPLVLEPVAINFPYQQPNPSSGSSPASSQYPLPAANVNRPSYLQSTTKAPSQTVLGSSGQYSTTIRPPYSQTVTQTSKLSTQQLAAAAKPDKPNKLSGFNFTGKTALQSHP